jgi:ATP-dependent Clp protease ATP-binding subunit ClpC
MNEQASQPNLQSLRARKARLGHTVGKSGYQILCVVLALLVVGVPVLYIEQFMQFAYVAAALALVVFMFIAWYKLELKPLPVQGDQLDNRLSADVLSRLTAKQLTPDGVWKSLKPHWQLVFLCNHFFLPPEIIEQHLRAGTVDMARMWQNAGQIATATECEAIEPGHIAGALMLNSPQVVEMFTHMKMTTSDIEAVIRWLGRGLEDMRREKPYFGGIGRDWASGFTPELNRFGENISLAIERHGSHFGWLTTSAGVTGIKNALAQGATSIALIGAPGVGKTSHVYALAQLLLEETHIRNLEHHQVVGLNPSLILSSARRPGELENIVMNLLGETAHAGNIVLFLDDANLFFGTGTGSFDMTQILQPVLQNRVVQLVMAMTPNDYQHLKMSNPAFAGQLTPVVLNEPSEHDVMRVLEDTAMGLEHRNNVLVTYDAIREAYRLSGRYDQDAAYPGRAIRLLEQSIPQADKGVVTGAAVQKAIEQTRGVKVGSAAPLEADELLHLEDSIHQRMINQTRAVSVVSAALRRARAGVSNPKRPIGSFLFLGPTGVGKTELAKAIAATYFGAESSMIRLDMSEYQQPDDVQRLLSSGANESKSLIMSVRQQPFSVVLLDEIEKAHPNVLNLMLQLLDEGQLTDVSGRAASFKDCIIIVTSNAGAQEIRERIEHGEQLESFEQQFTDNLINSGQFKPELLNRFDEIVLFRPLKPEELAQVVGLMMTDVNKTLATQNIFVELTPAATNKIVEVGYDPRLGARPMRRMLQRTVEDSIAGRILRNETKPGDHVVLDIADLSNLQR